MTVKTQLSCKSGSLPVTQSFVLHHDSGFTGHKALILTTTIESVLASRPVFYANLRAFGRTSKISFRLHSGASGISPRIGTVVMRRNMLSNTSQMTVSHAKNPIIIGTGNLMTGRGRSLTLPSAPEGPAVHFWKGTRDCNFSRSSGGHLKLVNESTGREVAVFEQKARREKDGYLYICLEGISDAYLVEIVASFLAVVEQESRDAVATAGGGTA